MEKVAVIDLGSNTARLVIARLLDNGAFVVFDEMKEAVPLGRDMERDGFLKSARVSDTIKTLKIFKKLCEAHGVEKITAVATAAVRRAKNQKSFAEEVASATGIKLKVLTEEEEALYVYQGVVNSIDIPKGIIMEVGGGSTKLIYYNRRNIINHAILPFGAVTLADLFLSDGAKPEVQAAKIEEFFTEHLAKYTWLKDTDEDTQFIGVGASFRNLGKICRRVKRYPLDMEHNYVAERADFLKVYDLVKTMEFDKRQKIKGLSNARADIFPSALAIIKAFFDYKNFPDITISASGLREGILFTPAVMPSPDRPLSDVLGHSLSAVSKSYGENEPNLEQVYSLAMQLFKQLRVLHKFPRQYIKVLRVASRMLGAGKRVSFYNYPRHSFYTILNSNLYGISHRDLVMAAFVAAATGEDGVPPEEYVRFKDLLSDEDAEAVGRLGVILKIAFSFDRGMAGKIKALNCDVLGDSVILKTGSEGDASLEITQTQAVSSEFKKIFKKTLEIL